MPLFYIAVANKNPHKAMKYQKEINSIIKELSNNDPVFVENIGIFIDFTVVSQNIERGICSGDSLMNQLDIAKKTISSYLF